MTIEKHEYSGEATIGTTREYGSMRLIESIMSGTLDDGREVEVLRCALGRPYFEIKIKGEDRHMRINLMDVLLGLAEKLGEFTAKPAEATS
ncbi:hypothetical protein [Tritonibacter mobilis]|uniref:hypothetical protein n=1 Tax=Tritonibacter mobilis TaxID=379347 RepID=UPI003A5C5BB3